MPIFGVTADPDFRYSINTFVGTGEQVSWEVSFAGGYLSKAHVKAVETDLVGNNTERTLAWADDSTVIIEPPVPYGHALTVYRETPKTAPIANFNDGAVINETSLDTNASQAVFIAAEAIDRGEGALAEIAPRAILAPVGEIAPGLPPRTTLLGKLLGIGLDGKIVGIAFGADGELIADASQISFDGQILRDALRARIAELELNTQGLTDTAEAVAAVSDAIFDQAESTAALDTRLTQLRTEHDSLTAVVDALAVLEGDTSGLATLIANETSARTTADSALAAKIALIGATDGPGTAFILDLDNVKVSPTETLADRLEYLDAEDVDASARITDEQTARITGDAAEATARTTLAATLRGETAAAISAEQSARTTGDSAEATARTTLAATLRSETATAVSGEASARNAAITAAINSEASVRADADGVFAQNFTMLGARNAGGTAFVLDQSKVLLTGGSSLGTILSGIDVSIGAVSATVATEATARANADSSLATSINTVATNLGGLSASVTTLSSATSGLQARYGVSLDVNGYITGFVQNNDGTSGNFLILADKFTIGAPGATFTPFEVSGGVVRIKEAVIGTLTVDKLTNGTLGANVLVNGQLNIGSGKIIFDNGSFMKVSGVGFGSASQFIEWFGPKMAISSCTEANAISYLKTNGSAYFGGSLSAGVLKNAVRTSALSSTATVETGFYGSNGGTISVIISYTWTATQSKSYSADSTGVSQYNADVATFGGSGSPSEFHGSLAEGGTVGVSVERAVGGGGYSAATSLTISGGTRSMDGIKPVVGDSTGSATFTQSFNGSLTYTDPATSTATRSYRATITSRTFSALPTGQQQTVGIISTE